jgi:lipoate-protein ligase A
MPEGAVGRKGGKAVTVSNTAFPPYRLAARSWHLIIEPHGRPGAENMAIDQALLDEVERRGDLAYLRLYRWTPPCLSFGRNEPALARYDRETIARLGLDVVRRPTGGRAVWHDDEVTYAVAAPVDAMGCLRDSYRAIHQRLARALRTRGVDALLASPARRPGPLTAGACFAQPVGGEVLVGGRKVIGSAQVRQGAAFLQHGSILLGGSQDLVARVSRTRAPAASATTLSEALGRRVEFPEIARAIQETWLESEESWESDRPTALPPYRLAAFGTPAWTWRR